MISSYMRIRDALENFQERLLVVADKSNHFLHETLKQIAMRSRQGATMTVLSISNHLPQDATAEGHQMVPARSQAPAKSNNVDAKPSISSNDLTEISQTPVMKKVFGALPFPRDDLDQRPEFTHTPPSPRPR